MVRYKNLILVSSIILLVISITLSNIEKESSDSKMVFENNPDLKEAVFAGGCFWCMESPFEKLDGVKGVISGYTGGSEISPTYKEVSSGKTNHVEAIRILYDPSKIKYEKLLEVFWMQINPTDSEGQFVDRGNQYKSIIFYGNEEEKNIAEKSKIRLNNSGIFKNQIATEIAPLSAFYPAEEYHQDYYKKNPLRYNFYRAGSGRDRYLDEIWNEENKNFFNNGEKFEKPADDKLKEMLNPIQYKVTQKDGTEKPFDNEYWNNHEEGIYVDLVSGEPLFSSLDKFDSGTGWPSFTKPLEQGNIVEKEDKRLFLGTRIEIRSKGADSHLGHVFNDGPEPTGLRYCMNSAALKFIPKEELEKEGYGEYKDLF